MKIAFVFLGILVLTLCVVGLSSNRIALDPVNALSELQPLLSMAGVSEKGVLPILYPAEPVVIGMVGVVCVLFGSIAVFPLVAAKER